MNQELNKLFTSVPETITDISQIITESTQNPKNIYFVKSKKSIIVNGIVYSGLDSLSYDSSAILNSSNLLTSGTIYNELQKQTLFVNATITTTEDDYMRATLDKSYNEIYNAIKNGSKVYVYSPMYGGTYMIPTSFTNSQEHAFVTTMNGDIWLGFISKDNSDTIFTLRKFVVNNTIEEIQQYSESVDVSVGDTFEEAISKLIHIIEEDEYVTSSALNDLNTRLIDTSTYVDSLLPFTQVERDKLETIAANAEVNVQSDWNETNDSLDSYIQNKPTIPTKFSELTNDTSVDIIKSITEYTESIDISVGDTHDEAFSKIRKVINSNEKVVAAALNDLNDRLLDVTDEVDNITVPTKVSELINDSNYISSNDSSIVTAADIANWNSKTSNVGTITGITMNGVSKGDSGVVNLGTLVNNISYDSTNRKINLNYDSSVVSSIDANAFIKDGMVSNVTIADSSLIITFNTDADKEDIELSLTDIFDPDNYYNKTDVSSFTKVREITEYEDTTDVSVGDTHDVAISKLRQIIIDNEYVTAAALNDLETRKVDSSMLPTKLSQLTNDANYVQDTNYVHTDNNYTTAEKTKLANLTNYNFDSSAIQDSSNLLTSGAIYNELKKFVNTNIITVRYNTNTEQYDILNGSYDMYANNIILEHVNNNTSKYFIAMDNYHARGTNIILFFSDNTDYYISYDIISNTLIKSSKNYITNVTYSELLDYIHVSSLVAGKKYRITDYITTTDPSITDISTGNHQFDIIVTALSENKLSENASAIKHAGDTYFANSDLTAWELKYDIFNNKDRFDWADTTNGKGVIYYMKDEYNNICEYDFKNITFLSERNYLYTFYDNSNNDATITDTELHQNKNNTIYNIRYARESFISLPFVIVRASFNNTIRNTYKFISYCEVFNNNNIFNINGHEQYISFPSNQGIEYKYVSMNSNHDIVIWNPADHVLPININNTVAP